MKYLIIISALLFAACGKKETVIQTAAAVKCTVTSDQAIRLECSDGSVVEVPNTRSNGLGITQVIDPCGKQTVYDEVILQLSNGMFLAHFSDGNKEFLSLLPPGLYQTTDGTACRFRVTQDGRITSQ